MFYLLRAPTAPHPPPPSVHSPDIEYRQEDNVQIPQRGTQVLGHYRNVICLKA